MLASVSSWTLQLNSVALLIIFCITKISSGLQIQTQGLTLVTPEDEFVIYSGPDSPYFNRTDIQFENVGKAMAAFAVDKGANFSLLCEGLRVEGFKLKWTSNAASVRSLTSSFLFWQQRDRCSKKDFYASPLPKKMNRRWANFSAKVLNFKNSLSSCTLS